MTTRVGPIIHLRAGVVKGLEVISKLGKKYYSFQGIAYARPPVGELRFKPPQPVSPWEGVKDATREGNRAPHFDMVSKQFCGSEDCLYLNVYTPQIPNEGSTQLKAVMFWIHGGGFAYGHADSDVYGPDLLVQHDIVLVTVNYRLGVLGFLNLDMEGAAGNMGLKDQVAALQWVKQEIAAFGGNPNNVTIFGESAGGVCVHLHMLSNMSKGLFHKAIAQSGTALCNWAFTSIHRERAILLGKLLGCNSDNEKDLLQFFKTITPLMFASHQDDIMTNLDHLRGIDQAFIPSVEKSFKNVDCFLDEHPISLLKTGNIINDVPFITGTTKNEGISILFGIEKHAWFIPYLNSKFNLLIPEQVCDGSNSGVDKINALRENYFSDSTINREMSHQIAKLYTDLNFLLPMWESIEYHLKKGSSPIYCYQFSYDGKFGWYKRLMAKHRNMKTIPTGVCHADDLGYLFSNSILDLQSFEHGVKDMVVVDNITKLWATFAETGLSEADSFVAWDPITTDNINALDIGENVRKSEHMYEHLSSWIENGLTPTSTTY